MALDIHELKVNQTALPLNDHYLLISNINIPEAFLHQELNQVLERAKHFIVTDYVTAPNVQYQVCATYDLRHSHNGQIRTWTGSFNPRGSQLNALNRFQLFTESFQTDVQNACSDDNIYQKLRLFHLDTSWVFDRLVSIYITVQAVVPSHHPTILKRSLAAPRNGRNTRAQATFQLP